jgi:hypothetical protein
MDNLITEMYRPGALFRLMFWMKVLEIFSYAMHTILWYKIIVFIVKGQARNTMEDIKLKY